MSEFNDNKKTDSINAKSDVVENDIGKASLKGKKGKKDKKKNLSAQRLKEIIFVLRKHEILKGLSPEKVRLILEDLGPTFIKFGQIMSMRPDILPVQYCDEFTKLRSTVKPMEYKEVVKIVETEYSEKISSVFSSFSNDPVGSASIAQVHRATLKSDGSEVVVKVQRSNIREVMARDIALIKRAVHILMIFDKGDNPLDFIMLIDEMWMVAQQEMDFLLEANNMVEFAELNRDVEYVECPKVYMSLVTSKILVMEYVDGIPIDQTEKLEELGYNMEEIGEKLAANYSKQFLDDAFFHADPHPGNLWIRDGKIVWLDFGMVGRLSSRDRKLFSDAVVAMAQNDVYELKNIVLTLGTVNGRINHTRLYTDIDDFLIKYINSDLASLNLGLIMEELMEIARTHKISMPPGISMLARGGVTIEGVLEKCSPSISYIEMVKNYVSNDIVHSLDLGKIATDVSKDLLTSLLKAVKIPAQMSDLLKMTSKGQMKMNLDITGMDEPLKRVDDMVHKFILCVICAALLIGSSIVSTTQMEPKLMGIPALGAFGFLVAVILCVWVFVSIIKTKKR